MGRSSRPRARDSEATRAQILVAARERFATDGYERTTIRAVAGDAGIDPALVIRYFGNKEKLFAEAAEFDLRLGELPPLPRERAGELLLARFLGRWEADNSFTALVRAAVTNEVATNKVRMLFATQVLPTIAALSPDPESAPLRAGLVASQLMGIALGRYVLRLPPAVAMSREELLGNIGATLQHYLTGELVRSPPVRVDPGGRTSSRERVGGPVE